MKNKHLWFAALVVCAACGDNDESDTISEPATFAFESRFQPGVSSVAYSGQIKRHLLIEQLKAYIGNLDDQSFSNPEPGDVVDALNFFYDFKNSGVDDTLAIGFVPAVGPPLQVEWRDLGGSLVSLKEKFPEFDAGFEGNVVGYASGTLTPEGALQDMFQKVEQLIIDRANGNIPADPNGADIALAFVGADGIDYQQLIQKYLGGAIAISQGTDDYLDDDLAGKGLLSDNTVPAVSGGVEQAYTGLEHVWDEGFGYFGAAQHYNDFSDDEIASAGGRADWQGGNDADGDDAIDLLSEYNFGHSVNAGKRDRGSVVATDFTKTAFDAFIAGRTLIVNAGGALDDSQLAELQGYRDTAVGAWERAVAATAVHYINDVLQDMEDFGTADYDFLAHAKHWSELKGFALALQFNVNHSPLVTNELQLSTPPLEQLHSLIGDRPVLPGASEADQTAYKQSLNDAKALLGQVYQFDSANLGDADGLNGW